MNRIIAILAALTAAACVGLTLVGGPAQAAPGDVQTRQVVVSDCGFSTTNILIEQRTETATGFTAWKIVRILWSVANPNYPCHSAAPAVAHRGRTSYVGAGVCTPRGVTNYYVHHWQSVDAETILNSPFVFHERSCKVNGFRLYKSVSNTRAEVVFARHFLKHARNKKPVIFCRTATDRAYFLDLAFYWGMYGVHQLNAAERTHYAGWAHGYATRPGCRLFTPSAS